MDCEAVQHPCHQIMPKPSGVDLAGHRYNHTGRNLSSAIRDLWEVSSVHLPYKFIGFGAMDATKPYKFIGFGAMDATKPYRFIEFGAISVIQTTASLQNNHHVRWGAKPPC